MFPKTVYQQLSHEVQKTTLSKNLCFSDRYRMLYVIDVRLIDVFIKLFDCACMTNLFQSKSYIKKFTAKESFWTKMSVPIRMEVIIALEKKKTILGWGFLINSFSRLSISVQRKFRKRKKLDLKKQRKKIMSKYFDQLKHKRHCYA